MQYPAGFYYPAKTGLCKSPLSETRLSQLSQRAARQRRMSGIVIQLDARQLEARVRDLTRPLSLRQAPSTGHVSAPEVPLSTSPDVDVVLGRLHEMERRQQHFESLIVGETIKDEELESIRSKRVALEERQYALEQELKQWRRKMRMSNSDFVLVHTGGKNGNHVCTSCESLKIETARFKSLESALEFKEHELKVVKVAMEEMDKLVTVQKLKLNNLTRELAVSKVSLEAGRIHLEKPNNIQAQQSAQEGNLAQREVALLRGKHEVEAERTRQQAERQALLQARRDLQEARGDLERDRQKLKEEQAQNAIRLRPRPQQGEGREEQIHQQQRELHAEWQRLEKDREELNKERRVLEANFRVMENQRRELTEALTALENQSTNDVRENQSRSWFCCRIKSG